ncbi:MAG: DUF3488 and transglutaminase-like domain-containing protein [Methylomonas sp.]|jgi:transglutaminase-like putative cysteine protease
MQTAQITPRILVFLLGVVAFIVLPHYANIPPLILALFFLILGLRLYGIRKPARRTPNPVMLLITLLGITAILVQDLGQWSILLGVSVLVLAFGLKLLELNTGRDVYVVCFAGFIVTATHFLFSQSIAILIYGIIITCCLLAVLIAINSEQRRLPDALHIAGMLLLQALPLTAVIFVLFPRFPSPSWLHLSQNRMQTGLSETLEPGSVNDLQISQERVFRVKFSGDAPPLNQMYWRGPVLSYTDGKVWRMLHNDFTRFQDKLTLTGPVFRYTELLEPQAYNWVYALDLPAQYDNKLKRNGYYQLTSIDKQVKAAEYSLSSATQYNTGAITKTEYRESLQLPAQPSARIQALVQQLQGQDADPEAYIEKLLNYFREQHFSYTLQPPLLGDQPIENFLFDAKRGFCSHYATAFVYLMRTAKIPARVVTGYLGGQLNPIGQFLEIRQSNAHAWTEVWLEKKGWVRVDPTSALLLADTQQNGRIETLLTGEPDVEISEWSRTLRKLEQIRNNIDYQWQRWIIHYGDNSQTLVFSLLGMDNPISLAIGLLIAAGAVVLALSLMILRPRQKSAPPAVRLFKKFCRKMAKTGILIRAGEGASDYAQRAKRHHPELASLIDEITAIFIRLHYQRISNEQDLELLKQRVNEFPR